MTHAETYLKLREEIDKRADREAKFVKEIMRLNKKIENRCKHCKYKLHCDED